MEHNAICIREIKFYRRHNCCLFFSLPHWGKKRDPKQSPAERKNRVRVLLKCEAVLCLRQNFTTEPVTLLRASLLFCLKACITDR